MEAFFAFLEWGHLVKFAAINCAQQTTCSRFGVQGTPTIRIIYPHTSGKFLHFSFFILEDMIDFLIDLISENAPSRYGINADHSNDVHFWKALVLHHMEILQRDGQLSSQNVPNLQSFQ